MSVSGKKKKKKQTKETNKKTQKTSKTNHCWENYVSFLQFPEESLFLTKEVLPLQNAMTSSSSVSLIKQKEVQVMA